MLFLKQLITFLCYLNYLSKYTQTRSTKQFLLTPNYITTAPFNFCLCELQNHDDPLSPSFYHSLRNYGYNVFNSYNKKSKTARPMVDYRTPQTPWESLSRMLEAKKMEVETLLEKHSKSDDPVQMRLSYVQHTLNSKLSEKLRLNSPESGSHTLSMMADMKRFSPTNIDPRFREMLRYSSAGDVALTMHQTGFDTIMVNTDKEGWGGDINDLKSACESVRKIHRKRRPAIIMKDIIIHPIQIALALEKKADGVLLNSMFLGSELDSLLDSCMIMGTEAIVEVHTVKEAEYAMNLGSTILLINQWDRLEGKLRPDQALKVKQILPQEMITIAAGGIRTYEQIEELAIAGFDSICLGRKLAEEDVVDIIKSAKNNQLKMNPLIQSPLLNDAMWHRQMDQKLSSIKVPEYNYESEVISYKDEALDADLNSLIEPKIYNRDNNSSSNTSVEFAYENLHKMSLNELNSDLLNILSNKTEELYSPLNSSKTQDELLTELFYNAHFPNKTVFSFNASEPLDIDAEVEEFLKDEDKDFFLNLPPMPP